MYLLSSLHQEMTTFYEESEIIFIFLLLVLDSERLNILNILNILLSQYWPDCVQYWFLHDSALQLTTISHNKYYKRTYVPTIHLTDR